MKNAHMVFKVPGATKFEDFSYDAQEVDEDEVEKACGEGWYASLQEAKEAAAGAKPAEPDPVDPAPEHDTQSEPSTREELIAEAEGLGIEVDPGWNNRTLAARIRKAREG